MRAPAALDRFSPVLEGELHKAGGSARSPLFRMLHYQLGWVDQTGMATNRAPERPLGMLTLLSMQACGGSHEAALPAAAAVELAAAAASAQQQLKDGLPGPTEHPALWWVFGSAQGINATDALYALARIRMLDSIQNGLPAERVAEALKQLDATLLATNHGQHSVDTLLENGGGTKAYLQALEESCGTLCAYAAECGAILAGAGSTAQASLRQFGANLGAAWRLRQELDALWGNAARHGTSLVDVLEQRRSLPVVHAFAHASEAQHEQLQAAGTRKALLTDDELAKVLVTLEQTGARAATERELAQRVASATQALQQSDLDPAKLHDLEGLLAYLSQGPA